MKPAAAPPPRDPFATDTADPARVFRAMFPVIPATGAARIDWLLFERREDLKMFKLVDDDAVLVRAPPMIVTP